jgi:hypothetical protein
VCSEQHGHGRAAGEAVQGGAAPVQGLLQLRRLHAQLRGALRAPRRRQALVQAAAPAQVGQQEPDAAAGRAQQGVGAGERGLHAGSAAATQRGHVNEGKQVHLLLVMMQLV